MIRYAEHKDLCVIANCIKKFTENPPYNTRMFSLRYIVDNLHSALVSPDYDLIVEDVFGEIQGAACASQQPTLLCPEWEYHEHFVVALHPSATRSLVKWLVKRGEERQCFRTVIGSTTHNERYKKLVQVAGGLKPYGVTFVKEYRDG